MVELINFINACGFPIVGCVALAYYVKTTTDKNNETINNVLETHKEVVNGLTESLKENTQALIVLSDEIKKGVNKSEN